MSRNIRQLMRVFRRRMIVASRMVELLCIILVSLMLNMIIYLDLNLTKTFNNFKNLTLINNYGILAKGLGLGVSFIDLFGATIPRRISYAFFPFKTKKDSLTYPIPSSA